MIALANSGLASEVNLSRADASRIGQRIWQNECGGTVAGLTSWNAGEDFASLGIGHFIWYPKNQRGPFEESFPALVTVLSAHGATLPPVVKENRDCPWNSRAQFQAAQNSAEMKQLRQFLAGTIDLQALFLVQRLESSLPKMLREAPPAEREHIAARFRALAATRQGAYVMIDYVNFKGEGTLATERYHGEGWGLLQVLQNMRDSALDEFAASAKTVLRRRVANSPPARGEARWLKGWLSRVENYRAP